MPGGARGVARRPRLGALGSAVGGGAIAFTLMACYGAAPPPPCPDGTRDCHHKTDDAPPASSETPPAPQATTTSETPAATPSGADGGH